MRLRPHAAPAVGLAVLLSLAGCATGPTGASRPATDTEKGLGIGAATGAAAGAIIGSLSADAGKGALIGAIGGALIGGAVGSYMDRQHQDFERVLAQEIAQGDITLRKLPENELLVGMTSATTFNIDSAEIKPGFYSTMDKIADVVTKYGKTALVIAGYTDSTGSAEYNLGLSERRAEAVESYLISDGVAPARMRAVGYGMADPIASNQTEAGRRLNRRVQIRIIPITEESLAARDSDALRSVPALAARG